MKDPLREYTIKKALNQLGEQAINNLCNYCEPTVKFFDLHHDALCSAKITVWRETAATYLNENEARKAKADKFLKMALFFHRQKKAVPQLVQYVAKKNALKGYDAACIKDCKLGAEQALALAIHYYDEVEEYYCITMFNMPSRRYWSKRHDYMKGKNFEEYKPTIASLTEQVQEYFKPQGRGQDKHVNAFEDDECYYFAINLPDTPANMMQWTNSKPEQTPVRPVMDVVFVFDKNEEAIDIHAENVETQKAMHQICAKTLFNEEVEENEENNAIYCLETLLEFVRGNMPLRSTLDEASDVQHILVKSMRLQEIEYPYREIGLNTRMLKRRVLDEPSMCASDMHKMFTSVIITGADKKAEWHIEKLQPVHAELYAVYYDAALGRSVAKPFRITSRGGSNLHYSDEDKAIKAYLMSIGVLKNTAPIELKAEKAVA